MADEKLTDPPLATPDQAALLPNVGRVMARSGPLLGTQSDREKLIPFDHDYEYEYADDDLIICPCLSVRPGTRVPRSSSEPMYLVLYSRRRV